MTETQLRQRYDSERERFDALGHYVRDAVLSRVSTMEGVALSMPATVRTKDTDSLIQKALYRGKHYDDPYVEITDKVGVRFVVLLLGQIRQLQSCVETLEDFRYSKDRDFELERDASPTTFEYQSVHYVVKPTEEIVHNGLVIHPGMPCEVQIRTLLQHAYSELTHDTVYKSRVPANSRLKRLVARSMGLIEVTDAIFSEVAQQVSLLYSRMRDMLSRIELEYGDRLDFSPNEKLDLMLSEAYEELLREVSLEGVLEYLHEREYILSSVATRASGDLLFRQPFVLLLYYLVGVAPSRTAERWPLPSEMLDGIYTDLGISRDG